MEARQLSSSASTFNVGMMKVIWENNFVSSLTESASCGKVNRRRELLLEAGTRQKCWQALAARIKLRAQSWKKYLLLAQRDSSAATSWIGCWLMANRSWAGTISPPARRIF